MELFKGLLLVTVFLLEPPVVQVSEQPNANHALWYEEMRFLSDATRYELPKTPLLKSNKPQVDTPVLKPLDRPANLVSSREGGSGHLPVTLNRYGMLPSSTRYNRRNT